MANAYQLTTFKFLTAGFSFVLIFFVGVVAQPLPLKDNTETLFAKLSQERLQNIFEPIRSRFPVAELRDQKVFYKMDTYFDSLKKSHFETNPIQQYFENALAHILKNPVGMEFYLSLNCTPDFALLDLGFTKNVITEYTEKCMVAYIDRYKKRPNFINIQSTKVWPRQIYFVLDKKNQAQIDSWTTAHNETFFFIGPQVTENDFVLFLLHEFAISFDGKYSILPTTYFGFEQKLAMDRNKLDGDATIVIDNQFRTKFAEYIKRFDISREPLINLAFTVMRAYNYERLFSGEEINSSNSVSCYKNLYIQSERLLKIKDYIDFDDKSVKSLLDKTFPIKIEGKAISQKVDWNQTKNFILWMEKNPLLIESQGSQVEFCDYMQTPFLAPYLYSFNSKGPRPRTTGGYEGD
ncbi:MAG: hypothetical protein ACOYOK_13435 [Pseudobdellovibrionaceae bacterium]